MLPIARRDHAKIQPCSTLPYYGVAKEDDASYPLKNSAKYRPHRPRHR